MVNGSIRGAYYRVLVPWKSKHKPSVARMRNHDGRASAQKRLVKNKVDSLARTDHGLDFGFGEASHLVREDAACVDHHPDAEVKALPRFTVLHHKAIDKTVGHPLKTLSPRCSSTLWLHDQQPSPSGG